MTRAFVDESTEQRGDLDVSFDVDDAVGRHPTVRHALRNQMFLALRQIRLVHKVEA